MSTRFLVTLWAAIASSAMALPLAETGSSGFKAAPSEACPPCDALFGRLEPNGEGKYVQQVEVSERGEPKSGTAFMMEWVAGILFHVCDYLKELYGEESCVVQTGFAGDLKDASLTFQPDQAKNGKGRCVCSSVERVYISFKAHEKHLLPVPETCEFWRSGGIVHATPKCHFANGSGPKNYEDWRRCIEEAECDITDDRDQMSIFRDPRAVAVSTYFLFMRHDKRFRNSSTTVDEFALKMFPITCQWVLVRFILFEYIVSGRQRSISFWSQEALDEPIVWHQQMLDFLGLRLPDGRLRAASDAASRRDFQFKTKGIEEHPGGAAATTNRTYLDEISAETIARMDEMMLSWFPPDLLAKLGVSVFAA